MREEKPTETTPNALLQRLQAIRLPLWVGVGLLLLVVGVLAWKQVVVVTLERHQAAEIQATAQKFAAEKAALIGQARETAMRNSDDAHRLLGVTLAWAVRGELIRNNLDQIDQYFGELVKIKRFQLAVLADPGGKILVASDKKFHQGRFADIFPSQLLFAAQVTLHPIDDRTTLLVVPIMGLNTRLGTVVLRYVPPPSP